jgi:LysM repeat protein
MTAARMAALLPLLCLLLAALSPPARAARFTCNATAPRANTCHALIFYSPPNATATTLAAVRAVFQLRSHRGLLAANGLPPSTPTTAPAPSPVRVRMPCLCSGGVGATFQRPTYRVRAGDTLDAVAKGVFGGLVTFQDIAAANNVSDPNKVAVGQQLRIPVPCSCDPVGGRPVVHYTYVVPQGSSVAAIAQEFATTEETILAVNKMPDAKSLLAGQVLDVPLRGNNIVHPLFLLTSPCTTCSVLLLHALLFVFTSFHPFHARLLKVVSLLFRYFYLFKSCSFAICCSNFELFVGISNKTESELQQCNGISICAAVQKT